jgi:hypothetical protein
MFSPGGLASRLPYPENIHWPQLALNLQILVPEESNITQRLSRLIYTHTKSNYAVKNCKKQCNYYTK